MRGDIIVVEEHHRNAARTIVQQRIEMDLNAESEKVWSFYDDTLKKVHRFGTKIIRLDAFAYLHKRPGDANFYGCLSTGVCSPQPSY